MENGGKEILLFVHGFNSSAKCWDRMLELLRGDARIAARYEFFTWEYATNWAEINLFSRIPPLKEIGKSLGVEIDSPRYRNRRLTLVGHSQGGLVIQSYFESQLSGKARSLANIKQAIFFATPSAGSDFGMSIRLLLYTLFNNPQETTLRVLNPDAAEMQAIIRDRMVESEEDADHSWRIPIHAFCGMQDAIVPEASARGVFDNVKAVMGNHFTILRPPSREDTRYSEFAELLLEPGGHKHRFDVDRLVGEIRIEPRRNGSIRTANAQPRLVEFDNFATFKRTVVFSPANRCRDPFTLRYGTRRDGYVVGFPSRTPNLAPIHERGKWDDSGSYFQYDFLPEPGGEFALGLEIYKGFDEGQRDLHFHLGDRSHHSLIRYTLDLSAYLAAGYAISQEPSLLYDPTDREHGDLCRLHHFGQPVAPLAQEKAGIYAWELKDISGGILHFAWDVTSKASPAKASHGRPEGIGAHGRSDDKAT